MSDTVAALVIPGIFAVVTSIVGAVALLFSKRRESSDQRAANALAAIQALNDAQSAEIKELREENRRLRTDIDAIGTRTTDKRRPVSVLIVENEEADSFLTREILRMAPDLISDVSVVTSVDQAAGIEADVVLLDLGLDATDGMDTLRAMREIKPDQRIVVLTDDDRAGRDSRLLGAVDFVPKPMRMESHEFPERVADAINRTVTPYPARRRTDVPPVRA